MNIFAIDPGNEQSAFVVMGAKTYNPITFGKVNNCDLRAIIFEAIEKYQIQHFALEMVASYGMAVGKEVFNTCVWIGRFAELIENQGYSYSYVFRKDVKMHLCGSMRAKDTNVRMALIDRFAQHDFKNGKGKKNNKDWFYGFKADIWQAYAVGITYIDSK